MRTPLLLAAALLLSCPVWADSRHAPPPVTAVDLAPLKDAITALSNGPVRDLGDAASKTSTRLDVVEASLARIDRGLAAANLVQIGRDQTAAKAAWAEVLRREDGLESESHLLESRLAEAAADATRQNLEVRRMLGSGQSLLADLQHQDRQLGDTLAQQWRASAASAAADQQTIGRWMAAGAGACAGGLGLVIGSVALLQARARRRRHSEVLLALTRLGAEARQPRAVSADWQRMESRLLRLTERLEHAKFESNGAIEDALVTAEEEITVAAGPTDEPMVASRHLWPAEFLDPQSPLARWRFLLEGHFGDPERPALPVLAGLLGLRVALDRPAATPAEIGAAAYRLSEALHAYWQSLEELSADDRQQASSAWLQSMARMIGSQAPHLELREVMPGLRIDTDLMQAVREGSGNHLNVAEVYSWAVLDRSAARARVLHRAHIAST